ncbi:MAG: glutamine synthetase type III, partial [Spirochaetaceae bacterium]|nr:glutamine synthetase type III [Spirochaetaceae bacterium]
LAAVGAANAVQEQRAQRIAAGCANLVEECDRLASALSDAQRVDDPLAKAKAYRDSVVPSMDSLREVCDGLEDLMPKADCPFPNYEDLLYSL